MSNTGVNLSFDFSGIEKAMKSMHTWEIGPDASRTNPKGTSTTVVDPRSLLASKLNRVVDFAITSLRQKTPKSNKSSGQHVADSYNVRVGGAGTSKGAASFASYSIAAWDLPDDRQIVVNVLEYGSAPHVIRPKNARFLRFPIPPEQLATGGGGGGGSGRVTFVTHAGGKVYVNTTEVMHPGTRPYAMFRLTLEAVRPLAQKIATEVATEVAASFAAVDTRSKR